MEKKNIGEAIFLPTNEKLLYTDREEFINNVRDMVDVVGPNGVRAKVYNQNDLNLRYDIYSIIVGEYGYCVPRSQFLIVKGSPSFNLAEKLAAINHYEETHSGKNTITWRDGKDIFIADRIDESMSVKKIKNLIDRRYEKAMKCQKKTNQEGNILSHKSKSMKYQPER